MSHLMYYLVGVRPILHTSQTAGNIRLPLPIFVVSRMTHMRQVAVWAVQTVCKVYRVLCHKTATTTDHWKVSFFLVLPFLLPLYFWFVLVEQAKKRHQGQVLACVSHVEVSVLDTGTLVVWCLSKLSIWNNHCCSDFQEDTRIAWNFFIHLL